MLAIRQKGGAIPFRWTDGEIHPELHEMGIIWKNCTQNEGEKSWSEFDKRIKNNALNKKRRYHIKQHRQDAFAQIAVKKFIVAFKLFLRVKANMARSSSQQNVVVCSRTDR